MGGEPATVHRLTDDTYWCDQHADEALVCSVNHEHLPAGELLAPMFSSYWRYDTSAVMADPTTRNYRTDTNDLTVTQLAISTVDVEDVNRRDFLATLVPGDHFAVRSTTAQGDWSELVVTDDITDNTTWFQVPVVFVRQGDNAAVPSGNERMLFDFMRVT